MLERILTAVANSFIGAVLSNIFGAIRQRRIDQDQQEVGRKDERLANAKTQLEAEQRIKEAGAKPRDTQADLDGGRF